MNPWIPEHVSQLHPYVPGKSEADMARERGLTRVVKLASNENPMGPSPRVTEMLRSCDGSLHRYPDASGLDLREKLSEHHGVAVDQICLGNGSNELIDLACRTFVDPTVHAVYPDPSFVCYGMGLAAQNIPRTSVPLTADLEYDVEALLGAIRPDTRLLFVANPNNPTGTHIPGRGLRQLLEQAPPQVLVVVDEAYLEYATAPEYQSALEMQGLRERWMVLRTFSKAHGLAALRVGYAMGPAQEVAQFHRTRPPFNTNTLGQAAALVSLDDLAHIHRAVELNTRERLRVAQEVQAQMGWRIFPSQANFLCIETQEPSANVFDRLANRGITVRPMPAPISQCVRITIGLPEENDVLLQALRQEYHQ